MSQSTLGTAASWLFALIAVVGIISAIGLVCVVVWDCITYLPILRRYFRTLPTNTYGKAFGLLLAAATIPLWIGCPWLGALTISLMLLVLRYETQQYIVYLATAIAAKNREIEAAHGDAQRSGPEAQPDLG